MKSSNILWHLLVLKKMRILWSEWTLIQSPILDKNIKAFDFKMLKLLVHPCKYVLEFSLSLRNPEALEWKFTRIVRDLWSSCEIFIWSVSVRIIISKHVGTHRFSYHILLWYRLKHENLLSDRSYFNISWLFINKPKRTMM